MLSKYFVIAKKLCPSAVLGFNKIIQRTATKTFEGQKFDDLSNLNIKRYQYRQYWPRVYLVSKL